MDHQPMLSNLVIQSHLKMVTFNSSHTLWLSSSSNHHHSILGSRLSLLRPSNKLTTVILILNDLIRWLTTILLVRMLETMLSSEKR